MRGAGPFQRADDPPVLQAQRRRSSAEVPCSLPPFASSSPSASARGDRVPARPSPRQSPSDSRRSRRGIEAAARRSLYTIGHEHSVSNGHAAQSEARWQAPRDRRASRNPQPSRRCTSMAAPIIRKGFGVADRSSQEEPCDRRKHDGVPTVSCGGLLEGVTRTRRPRGSQLLTLPDRGGSRSTILRVPCEVASEPNLRIPESRWRLLVPENPESSSVLQGSRHATDSRLVTPPRACRCRHESQSAVPTRVLPRRGPNPRSAAANRRSYPAGSASA